MLTSWNCFFVVYSLFDKEHLTDTSTTALNHSTELLDVIRSPSIVQTKNNDCSNESNNDSSRTPILRGFHVSSWYRFKCLMVLTLDLPCGRRELQNFTQFSEMSTFCGMSWTYLESSREMDSKEYKHAWYG